MESRNLYSLNLRDIYKILNKEERVNADGRIVEFEKPQFLKNFWQSSISNALNTFVDGTNLTFEQWLQEKEEYFEKNSDSIKFWETPLRNTSFLKIFDKILKRMGILMRLKSLFDTSDVYNTNLMVPHRKVVKMISIKFHFDPEYYPLYNEEFETKLCEYIVSICKKTKYLREIIQDDIVVYNTSTIEVEEEVPPKIDATRETKRMKEKIDIIEGIADFLEKKNFLKKKPKVEEKQYIKVKRINTIEMKLNQVAMFEDFEDFEYDLLPKFKEKFGKKFSLECKCLKAFFNIELDDLGASNIKFMDKKKEKLVRKGNWAYYLPAGWILYNLNESKIPDNIKQNWVPVYHPIGGFNFNNYGNLGMCDDCGPNRYVKLLTNHPLDQGLFVTPRIKYIMGNS